MTSIYSQPIQSISYTEYESSKIDAIQPNYTNLLDDKNRTSTVDYNSTIDCQPNKLPFNFFLSMTEYNKMLIKNGKNMRRKAPQIIDGLTTNLQYVNDHIFQKQLSKKQRIKQAQKLQVQLAKRSIKSNCKCICSHYFCQQCTKNQSKCRKILRSDTKKNLSFDGDETLCFSKIKKYSISYKQNKIALNPRKKQKKSKKTRSLFEKSHSKKNPFVQENSKGKNNIKLNPDSINHHLIRSLIKFNQKKKAEYNSKVKAQKQKQTMQEYLRLFNEKIRSMNLQLSRRSVNFKSRSKSQSTSKHDRSLHYWNQIKDDVIKSLKNDNYSCSLKAQLRDYHLDLYDHKQIQPRNKKLSIDASEQLRHKRGRQASRAIREKNREKKRVVNWIFKNLHSLQKERKKRILKNPKKPFRPTANMIRFAFQNILQPFKKSKQAHQERSSQQIFFNEGIKIGRTVKNSSGKRQMSGTLT